MIKQREIQERIRTSYAEAYSGILKMGGKFNFFLIQYYNKYAL